MSIVGTATYIQNDEMLGRTAVPRVRQLQFAIAFIREEELPPKRSPNSFSAAGFFYTGKDLCIWAAAKTHI